MDGKSVEQSTLVDRISDLPDHVIDIILNRVSLRDAVRTSILSTKWRLHWTRGENLVLDYHFYNVLRDRRYDVEMYKGIVGNILMSYQGPIRKFVLHIPDSDNGDMISPEDINSWILAISRYGVQELTLDYDIYYTVVPSYVFQCMELKHLSLIGVQGLPDHFGQLSSLISLDLCCETINGDLISNIFLSCPLLERFSLDCDHDYGSFVVNASKLELLRVDYLYHLNFILKNTPNLSTVSLNSVAHPHGNLNIKCQGILDFFGAVPKIENITLTGNVLEEWAKQDVPRRLPAALENLLSLTVWNFNIYSEAHICSLFCLIESSPKLQNLDIEMHNPLFRPLGGRDYLQSHLRKAGNLRSLRTVKIKWLAGGKPEIDFIEFILSCCPMLEKLSLTGSGHDRIDYIKEFKMMAKIMRFRRASTQAELIYSS